MTEPSMISEHRPPTPPVEILLEEFHKPLGLSQMKAAQGIGIPLNRLNEIVRGRRGITTDSALRLARLLNTTPEFWMVLQMASDLYQASRALTVAEARPR